MYKIKISSTVLKFMDHLEAKQQRRIAEHIEMLRRKPRPRGSQKISNTNNIWRIRIGKYRILYAVLDDETLLLILHAEKRGDIYQHFLKSNR